YLRRELQKASEGLLDRTTKWFLDFKKNLIDGVGYYRGLAEQLSREQKEDFLRHLDALLKEIEYLLPEATAAVSLDSTS
ncbi:MAG: hypothetical protein KAT85_00590, partial [candidate division Zixibacteria bacterium]|nr:hypothetical protein [candidate division Zixibacteria bacterium]